MSVEEEHNFSLPEFVLPPAEILLEGGASLFKETSDFFSLALEIFFNRLGNLDLSFAQFVLLLIEIIVHVGELLFDFLLNEDTQVDQSDMSISF